MNISDSGSWTSLQKWPPLLPRRMSHVNDFINLHSFAPVNYSLQTGNHSQRYQCGGARDLPLRTDNSQRHYLHGGAGTPPPESYTHFVLRGDDLLRVESRMIANHVRGCLVCLAFGQDGKIFAELPGTIIRSDGIIATSASCLSSLKSKELKVTVDVRIPDTGETCKGVLLDADFGSNIAFVKIRSCKKPPGPAIGKFNFLRFRTFAVAAGCSFSHRGCELAEPRYVACYRSLPVSVIETAESRNASTSGQIIEVVANKSEPADIGGCFVDPLQGVVGIVHSVHDSEVKGTPIDIVFKTLEDIKMHRAIPESDFGGVEATV